MQGLGSAISSDLGIFSQIFYYASRHPMVALCLDSLPTTFAPPPSWQISGYAPATSLAIGNATSLFLYSDVRKLKDILGFSKDRDN